jgi:hypothetical protein
MEDADIFPVLIGTKGGTVLKAAAGAAIIGPYN